MGRSTSKSKANQNVIKTLETKFTCCEVMQYVQYEQRFSVASHIDTQYVRLKIMQLKVRSEFLSWLFIYSEI